MGLPSIIKEVWSSPDKPIPNWKPIEGKIYYGVNLHPSKYQRYERIYWFGGFPESWYYDLGLIFETKEDAIKASSMILEVVSWE